MSSMPLPAPLQAWASWLSWFSPELVAQIGPLLIRMHPMLGRLSGQRQGPPHEPDGLGDLQRRGSYERLLPSEWLLASEIPDEFLRRAASAEHLFLAPRPRAQRADPLVLALFDTGPWQLGAPRLAQMALWILLARRAQEAGGQLRWGSLQRPGEWHGAESVDDLRRFLTARCFEPAAADQWPRWTQWLDQQAVRAGECWWVGHHPQAGATPGGRAPTHAVQIRRDLVGEALEVLWRSGASLRTQQLSLPLAHAGAMLLKGRFTHEIAHPGPRAVTSDKLSLRFAPIIAEQGYRVAVPLLDERGVMVFQLTAAVHAARHTPRRQNWSKGLHPLAAAFSGKVFGAVLNGPESLQFWQIAGMGLRDKPPREQFESPPGRGTLLPMRWAREGQQVGAYVIDAAGRLVLWSDQVPQATAPSPAPPEVLDTAVLAMATVEGLRIVYVCRHAGRVWLRFAGRHRRAAFQSVVNLAPDPGADDARAFLAAAGRWAIASGGLALRMSASDGAESWRIYESPTTSEDAWSAALARGQRAVGLVKRQRTSGYGLVVLSHQRRQLWMQSPSEQTLLWESVAPIERVSVCPCSGVVAMLTSERTLHVWSSQVEGMVLTVQATGEVQRAGDAHG
ncbi:hypothetical protein AACH06_01860 [Ideonella sp. DXS29W]|uniref:Uncharacterized protein n=1 Tax=Ideonella lacteola TaxID=2984193 RepID=A0ABU9BJ88_9BURK